MEKFTKSPEQITMQIEHWFLRYFKKSKTIFNGSEPFTLFKRLQADKQNEFIVKMNLTAEIPVLLLTVAPGEYIVNTTERFIRIKQADIESLYYTEFDSHYGFKSIRANATAGKIVNIKTEGSVTDFGLCKTNADIIYWKIPTGSPGFAFWNVTNHCSLIGRKYIIKK